MKENKGHVPVRTCISCGTKRGKKELIRLILDSHGLLVRDDGKGQGRGAYVCPDRSCWENLKKGKRISRAFRKEGPLAFHPDLRFE
ncbi:MAG: YlxR family protein [Deltaproteobacteria bacterium]|nr:YlxR family protein [Deltaproteobacteria bacterium]